MKKIYIDDLAKFKALMKKHGLPEIKTKPDKPKIAA